MRGQRIALVGPQSPPAGGMARQREQLTDHLRAEGWQVMTVSVNAPYRPAWAGRLRGLRALVRLLPYLARLWRVCGECDLLHVMANSGWAFHFFAAPAVWIARLRGVPVVMGYHGGLAQEFLSRQSRWVRPTLARVTLIVPSGFLQAVFADFGFAATVVPNSVDLAQFSKPDGPRTRGAHIVVTRNLEPVYDIGTAIRAFSTVAAARPDARLTIAGSGPDLAALKLLCEQLKVSEKVRFAGRLIATEMAALYRSADLMLNPSLADNMPNAVLEALASGVPVVSTRVGGVPWLVRDEHTALLVPPGEAAPMAAAMLRVLDDAGLARRLADHGRALVAQYDWAAVRLRLLGVYGRAAASTLGCER